MTKIFIIAAFCFIISNAQGQSITVGTDKSIAQSPYLSYYEYGFNQTIYLENEIQSSGNITALTYYYTGSSLSGSDSLAIWIGVVGRDYFSQNNYWIPLNSMTKVFQGALTNYTVPGPITIPLQTSFNYNGIDNIVIAVNELRAGSDTGSFKGYGGGFGRYGRVLVTNNYPYPVDPNNPPSHSIRGDIGYVSITGLSKLPCQSPKNIRFSNIGSSSAKVNWSPSDLQSSPSGYDVYYSLSRTKPTAATGSVDSTPTPADTSKILNGLMPLTTYYAWVRSRCSSIGAKSVWTIVDSFTTTQIVTPVTLMEFTGTPLSARRGAGGEANLLAWRTATEQNNKGFELQRSLNGAEFSTISFIPSLAKNGNSTAILTYNYIDKNPPLGGRGAYYRLKQVDFDGKATLSNVVLIQGSMNNELALAALYPNPATQVLKVMLLAPLAQKAQIVITDIAGKVVQQQTLNLVKGENNNAVNVATLTKGSYMIKIICADGCERATGKFVKE